MKRVSRPTLADGTQVLDIDENFGQLRRIGSGSFSHIYRCQRKTTKQVGCLKVLQASKARDCIDEAKLLLRAQGHASVCSLLDVFYCADTHYPVLFLEVLEDLPLRMEAGELCDLSGDISSALAYIWRQQLVHNDVKPSNVLRRQPRPIYVLADFGCSFIFRTKHGAIDTVGDAHYLAEDRFQGQCPLDAHKIDIYALGLTLAEKSFGVGPAEWMSPDNFSPREAKNAVVQRLVDLPLSLQFLVDWTIKGCADRPSAQQLETWLVTRKE